MNILRGKVMDGTDSGNSGVKPPVAGAIFIFVHKFLKKFDQFQIVSITFVQLFHEFL